MSHVARSFLRLSGVLTAWQAARAQPNVSEGGGDAGVAPRLGDGSAVDWWLAFKLNAAAFPGCSGTPKCIFGGEVEDYSRGSGLQYLLSSGAGGETQAMKLHSDCIGSGEDPVAKTFSQIWDGTATNYVIWNDQFYGDPVPSVSPHCEGKACDAPWGHSKGALGWDAQGNGFVMQVTTPDWPGNGDKSKPRQSQGNTLGCLADDDVLVSQHFLSVRLSAKDTEAVLLALQRASVVTDPGNTQLVKLSDSPARLAQLAKGLGQVVESQELLQQTLSVTTSSGQPIRLLAKPSGLHVPPWQLVSSTLGEGLRTATWWERAEAIPSTRAGEVPGCWAEGLASPKEVQVATTGQWQGKSYGLTGGANADRNHAKLGHGLASNLCIGGDMNQEGALSPSDRACDSHQNGRGGLFFVLDDATLHSGLAEAMKGDTADYASGGDTPGPRPRPKPRPDPHGHPHPQPAGSCGGAGTSWQSCKAKGCKYVHAKEAKACGVDRYGCYPAETLASSCKRLAEPVLVV